MTSSASTFSKELTINMPQMAIEALSENWLFKEIGDVHWDLLCKGLNMKSSEIKDELNNRLYATFVRIRYKGNHDLSSFNESEKVQLQADIKRFGHSMYHSKIGLLAKDKKIEAELLTSFSIRNDSDNSKLVKSQPIISANHIPEHESLPEFANQYRLLKKKEVQAIELNETVFEQTDNSIASIEYELNPYYDLNGVGLLYFAAYPIINDVCEAKYFNKLNNDSSNWELEYSTIARDVFYFANCNIQDRIEYVLHDYQFLDQKIKLSSSLIRKRDGAILSKIFTIKVLRQNGHRNPNHSKLLINDTNQ